MRIIIIIFFFIIEMVSIVYGSSLITTVEPFEIDKSGAEVYIDVTYEKINDTAYNFCFDFNDKSKYIAELSKIDDKLKASEDAIPITKLTGNNTYHISKTNLDMGTNLFDWSSKDCIILNYDKFENISFKIGWNSITISTLEDLHFEYPNADKCVFGNGGDIFCVYKEVGAQDIYFANSSDNGTTWTETEILEAYTYYPSLLIDSTGKLIVYYVDRGDGELEAINSTDNGTTWTESYVIHTTVNVLYTYQPVCALNSSDDLHCVLVFTGPDALYVDYSTGCYLGFEALNIASIDIHITGNDTIILGSIDYGSDYLNVYYDIDCLHSDSTKTQILDIDTGGSLSYLDITSIDDKVFIAGTEYNTTVSRYEPFIVNSTLSDLSTWTKYEILLGDYGYYPHITSTTDGNLKMIIRKGNAGVRYGYIYNSTDEGATWNLENYNISDYDVGVFVGSIYPDFNKVQDGLVHLVFQNISSNNLIYQNLTYNYVAPPDTCTYTSGNWEVDCSDNCEITGSVDLNGNNISIIGTGTFYINNANISNYEEVMIEGTDGSNQCIVTCINGGCFI